MTSKEISKVLDKALTREKIKHETAIAIRDLLEAARKKYGAEAWDDDSVEQAVLELVTEEDPS